MTIMVVVRGGNRGAGDDVSKWLCSRGEEVV